MPSSGRQGIGGSGLRNTSLIATRRLRPRKPHFLGLIVAWRWRSPKPWRLTVVSSKPHLRPDPGRSSIRLASNWPAAIEARPAADGPGP